MIYIPLSRMTQVHFFEFRLCRWVIFMSSRGQSKLQTQLLDSKIGFPDLNQLTHISESRLQLWWFSTMNLKLVNRLFHLFTASKLWWFLLSYSFFFEWSFPRISYTAAISASARVQHWKLALQFFQATWKATIDLVCHIYERVEHDTFSLYQPSKTGGRCYFHQEPWTSLRSRWVGSPSSGKRSNYSDVTRPGPPKSSSLEGTWDPLISGKSRLVKYYFGGSFKYLLFSALLGEDSNFD